MKIEINYDDLKIFLASIIDKNIGCHECPFYDKCDGAEDEYDCAEIYIDNLIKGE